MHSIWAVARNTMAQAVRMKIAAAVIFLLLALLPMMSVITTGDGTLLGKLQSFSSYGISLVSFLLSILTISMACFTLSSDLHRRTLDLVVTKPIARCQIVLGKFLGVMVLNLILLAGFACIVYGLTMAMPSLTDSDPAQQAQAETEFFTARKSVSVQIEADAVAKRVEERIEKLKKEGQMPDQMSLSQIRQTLTQQEQVSEKSVELAAAKEWDFQNVFPPRDPNAVLFVRYKLLASPDPPNEEIFGQWRIGDFRQFKMGIQKFKTPVYAMEQSDSVRTIHEIKIPAAAVAEDGHVTVAFFNSPDYNVSTVIFEQMEVLYKVGSFGTNFFRVVLLIAVRLIFLAALGVSLSTWLSFPVAALCSLNVFFAGLVNGFFMEAIGSLGAFLGLVYQFTIRWMLHIIPRFDGPYSPTDYIVSGEVLPWLFLIRAALLTLGVQMLLLLAVGIWIFHRREIAKITV